MINYKAIRNEMISFMEAQGFPRQTLDRVCLTEEDLSIIHKVIQKVQPHTICEVGSYVGISTCLLALLTGGDVVTVDPNFTVAADVKKDGYYIDKKTGYYFDLLVNHLSLQNRIQRFTAYFSCKPSNLAVEFHAQYNPDMNEIPLITNELDNYGSFDLFFIDGDHDATCVYSDINKAIEFASESTYIIAHDTKGYWGQQVLKGVNAFIQENKEFRFQCMDNIGILYKSNKEEI